MGNKPASYYPLVFVLGYLAFCLSVSVAGPIEYDGYDKLSTTAFMMAVCTMFTVGFFLGIRTKVSVSSKYSDRQLSTAISTLFRVCFTLAIASVVVIFLKSLASGSLSFNVAQSGEAYLQSYAGYERNTGTYSFDFLLTSFFAFPTYAATIWGIFFFRDLSRKRKILLILMIVATILVFTVSGGKQKQFGDYLIYFLTLYFIKTVLSGRFSPKAVIVGIFVLVTGIITFLTILSFRYSASGVSLANLNSVIHPMMYFDEQHLSVRLLGEDVGFALGMFSGYLGQGFYGLSLSLEQDFTWTAFSGSSYSWSVILNRFLGFPFMVEQSYPYIVGNTTGWGQTKWHSVYAWLASDFTFTGTVFLNGVIGYIFAQLWKEILLFKNPFSILFFCLLCVGAFYAPANNQLMHSPGGLFTLILTVFFYYKYRASYNFQSLTPKSLA